MRGKGRGRDDGEEGLVCGRVRIIDEPGVTSVLAVLAEAEELSFEAVVLEFVEVDVIDGAVVEADADVVIFVAAAAVLGAVTVEEVITAAGCTRLETAAAPEDFIF